MGKKSKYTIEYLKELCKEKDLKLVGIDHKELNGKNRRCACIICNKHQDKGIQWIPVEKIGQNNKPCQYCNHSKLKETFKDEMAQINPDIEILSEYKNWNTKIKCKCKICGNEWNGNVSSLLYGSGCKICGYKKVWNTRGRKTTQDIVNEVAAISPNIEVLGEYTTCHEKILCKCKTHNTQWNIIVSHLLQGATNCPICQSVRTRERCGLSKEEVFKQIQERNPHLSIISDYETVDTKMTLYCKLHDYQFETTPRTFLYKNSLGCPMCSFENNRWNHAFDDDLYKYYVEDVFGYVYKGRESIDGKMVISFMCRKHIDKGIQKISFHNLKASKQCCRYCTGYLRTTEDFQNILNNKNVNVTLVGEFSGMSHRIESKCNTCGYIWTPLAYNLNGGCGCPICQSSATENKVARILDKYKIQYVRQKRFPDCKDTNTLPFDFYIKDFNICIEYDGEQHYKPVNWTGEMTDDQLQERFKKVQKHDQIKTEYCKNNNIQLIRIPYWEKNNIECFLLDKFREINIDLKIA